MKSILMEDNYELHLEITGNEWRQSDILSGSLKIQNKLSKKLAPSKQTIILGYADQKKLKALADQAYTVLNKIEFAIPEIAANGSFFKEWSLDLEDNFYITDKKHSPYLFFGDMNKKIPTSLMLNISPNIVISKILETWEVFFRFKVKEIISTKDKSLEINLIPPPSRELASLDSLKLKLKRNKPHLDFELNVKLKSLVADTTGMKLNFSEKKVQGQWLENKYLMMPGHLNLEYVQNEIKNIINSCISKK